uniref:Uncharacterized protein n=1 Tax=Heterorhabditis bacteriophora TaxID=37862 RepID=A0A1I7WDH5_HETBA
MVRIRILPSQGNNNVASRCREASLSRGNTRAYALVNGLANGENPYWLPKPDHSGSMSGRKITCLRLVAVSLYYYPLIGCFVIQGSRNTYIIELIIITILLSKLKRLYTVCRSKIYIGIYKYQYYWYDLPKIF